jgi:glycine dehydrogenase subunit 1
LASGGPYFGFICCKQKLVRQMPGRIIGRTVDLEGKEGFTLTLQAREQHIRRSKATSNICTNQGLAVTAATIYLTLLGFEGLLQVAKASHHNTNLLVSKLQSVNGVTVRSPKTIFHEFVIELDRNVAGVIDLMAEQGVLAGFDLSPYYSEAYSDLDNCLLVCVTEVKVEADLDLFVESLKRALQQGVA